MAAETSTAYFLHYGAHSDFEDGIFVPYATQAEAERQAAWDILHGCDPDFIEQIFEAEHYVPKRAWTRSQLEEVDRPHSPHLVEANRKRVATSKQIVQRASRHLDDIRDEMVKAQADEILAIHKALREGSFFKNAVPGNAYTWCTGGTATAGAAALTAATAKTLVLLLAAASNQPSIVQFEIGFDGVTASGVPVLVELVSGTAGAAGTPRATLAAGKQLRGWPAQASQTTCGDTYSAEPTTQLVNHKWLISPNGGTQTIQLPLGREPTGIVTAATDAKTWSIRATAPASVNAHVTVEFEE